MESGLLHMADPRCPQCWRPCTRDTDKNPKTWMCSCTDTCTQHRTLDRRHPITMTAAILGFLLVGVGGVAAILQAYGKLPSPVDSGAIVVYVLCTLFLLISGGIITFSRRPNS